VARHHLPAGFTPRQNDLLRLVAAGHTNTQIARRLGISKATVRTHLETSTNGWASPAAPPPSPAPSPTGPHSARQPDPVTGRDSEADNPQLPPMRIAESVLGGASSAGLAKQHTMSSYLRE
jgi:predicted transcriptional regulator